MALAADRFKAMILLFFQYCTSVCCGLVYGAVFSVFCNHLAGFLILIVLMSFCYVYSVTLLRGAEDFSAICNCVIAWSYSLTFRDVGIIQL